MSFYPMMPEIRPNRMVPKEKKDKDYHRLNARFCVSSANTGMIMRMHAKMEAAERAYNDMIITPEDVATVLVDESKQSRNRVFLTFNMIKPLVEQHRGTMLRSKFNATINPVTYHTTTRKQIALGHKLLAHQHAMTSPTMKYILSQRYDMGDTIEETMARHENFQDEYLAALRHLSQSAAKLAFEGDDTGMEILQYLFSGVTCGMFRPEGSFVRYRSFSPKNLIWDTSSERLDFADSAWMGMRTPMDLTDIAETFPDVDRNELEYCEQQIRLYSGFGSVASNSFPQMQFNSKLQVHSVYWKDVAFCEVGYINGIGGVPTLVKVGYDEGEKKNVVTYNDLIAPPDNEQNKELFKGKKVRKSTVEVTRFCDFIPWEYMMGPSKGLDGAKPEDLPDLVLDYGLYDLQGYNPLDPMKTANPIKAYRYAVADGEIVTPVQASIDPNRFAIRVLSALEGQMNMAGGKGTVINNDMLHPSMQNGEGERRIKNSETLIVEGGPNAAQTAVSSYDNTPGQGTYGLMQVVAAVQDLVNTVQGTPSATTQPERNQTTGVTEMVTANAALMHEAIYDGYNGLQTQKWKFLVTAGKEWYLERPDVLFDLIDERDYLPLLLTEEVSIERLNATVERDNPDQTKRQLVNGWLDTLFQIGAIPPELYYQLYNVSYFEDAAKALKLYSAQLKQAQNEAEKQARKEEMQDGLVAKQAELDARKQDLLDKKHETSSKLADTAMKSHAGIERDVVKAAVTPAKLSGATKKGVPA